MSRPSWAAPVRTDDEKKIIFSYPVSLPSLGLGNFILQTTESGAIESKSVSAPANQEPADIVQPASLVLSPSTLNLVASAESGGAIQLSDLLNYLLDIPFSVSGVEMPIRSLFGSLLSRVSGVEANVADISGVRLAAEEAKSALNDITDAMQDVSGALVELRTATLQSDLSGVLVRVAALEGVAPVDLSGVLTRLDGAESQIALLANVKLDIATYDGEKVSFAAAGDLANLDTRVGAAESGLTSAGSRLDALESAVPSKVAQADYDVYVAANDAAVAAAASAASSAASDAAAASALASAAEVKGLMSKLEVEDNSTAGISGAYWAETQGATLAGIMDAGKIASYLFDAPHAELTIPATVGGSAAAAGAVRRLRNAHASAVLPISLGGVSYEVVAKETAIFQHNGTEWRLL
jgi:hypothetical protein